MLELIVVEKVELIEEVPYVNAAKGVHLRERQNTGEAGGSVSPRARALSSDWYTYLRSSTDLSCENQLTLTTFSYSSRVLMAMGI